MICSSSLMPAIAYTIDMNYRTGGIYGLNETILASALAALAFSILSVQPLTIVGGASGRAPYADCESSQAECVQLRD
jgi:hypothetical protein